MFLPVPFVSPILRTSAWVIFEGDLRGEEAAADEPCNPSTAKTQGRRGSDPRVSNRLAAKAKRHKG
jgi:hypothetical protein